MNLQNWQAQLRKGLLELAILNLLRHGKLHGYEMVRLLKTMEGFSIHEGNIYPILTRLRKEGLVERTTQPSSGGPPRNYFSLTPQGQTTLQLMDSHWDKVTENIQNIRKGTFE